MAADPSSRSTQQVFDDHLRRRCVHDFEGDLAANYAPDVSMLNADGVFRGHEGVRQLHRRLSRDLPDGRYHYLARVVDGEAAFLAWSAESADGHTVCDGADSFVIRHGRIVTQTIHYTVRSR
jgi:hypothetical protein